MSSDGRPVFVDHVHGTHTVAIPPGEHVSLPLGGRWEQRIGAGHRLFFVDHELKVTQWGVPEEYVVPIALSSWCDRKVVVHRAVNVFCTFYAPDSPHVMLQHAEVVSKARHE